MIVPPFVIDPELETDIRAAVERKRVWDAAQPKKVFRPERLSRRREPSVRQPDPGFVRKVMLERALLALRDPEGEIDAEFPVWQPAALGLIRRYGVRRRRPVRVVRNHHDDRALAHRLGIPPRQLHGMLSCPGHDDDHPSLSWRWADSKLLLHCFSGCDFERIRQTAAG
jgi:hypothetical protein